MIDKRPRKAGSGMNSHSTWIRPGEHRNPAGRPPKPRANAANRGPAADDVFGRAAARKIRVQDFGKHTEMSAADLAMNKLIAKANGGDTRALIEVTRELRQRDEADKARREELYDEALEMKIEMNVEIQRAKLCGLVAPVFSIHPDDIGFLKTGDVVLLNRNVDREDAKSFRQLWQWRKNSLEELALLENDLRHATTAEDRAFYRDQMRPVRRMLKILEPLFDPRNELQDIEDFVRAEAAARVSRMFKPERTVDVPSAKARATRRKRHPGGFSI